MKHFSKFMFCFVMLTASILHSNEDLKNQLMFYYAARIQPWHIAARQAVAKFNKQYPDQKLEELKCKQLGYLSFTLKKIFYLNVTPHDSYRNYHAELAGPHLHKRHLSILPETHFKQIYYMLINHVVGKPK